MTLPIVLVVNAGSSSIKVSDFAIGPGGGLTLRLDGAVDGIGARPHLTIHDAVGTRHADQDLAPDQGADHHRAIATLARWLLGHAGADVALAAIGHRVVHGGIAHSGPALIDDALVADLEALVPLAPLHQPYAIDAIRAARSIAPGVPQVACFDTAFHRSQPELAQLFALPRDLTAEGVRRYGFHGLSYEYVAGLLPSLDPALADGRVIVAHLGNGASLCAMRAGRSVATTMGFTAVDGLPMGTRTGALDPGVLLYLMDRHGMDRAALESLIYTKSGLLGVSGVSSDMRTLMDSADPRAAEAIDLFVYRIGREIGSLAAALGGLDALVFTGGIGEHAAPIRERVCRDAAWLGVGFDPAANASGGPRLSPPGAKVTAWVVETDEGRMIARHTVDLLGRRGLLERSLLAPESVGAFLPYSERKITH